MNAFRIAAVLCALLTPYAMAQAPSQPMVPSATGGSSLATPVSGANGGTGVANTGSTITLGASVVTTGAGAPTLAFPATPQTYTFPTGSASLAPLASPTFTGTVTLPDATTAATNLAIGGNAILTGPGAANLQLGAANVNGTPVAQKISFQGALAGSATNQASANTTIVGSLGTGTGTNGDIIFQTGVKTTTGTAQATPTTTFTIKGEGGSVIVGAGKITDYGSGQIGIGGGSGNIIYASSGNFNIGNSALRWQSSSDAVSGTADLVLSRKGAANLQLGPADAASPVPQTFSFQSVVGGTLDTGGVNTTIIGSRSTGSGVGGNILIEVAKTGTSATTQNNAFPMLSVIAGGATTATVQFGDGSNFTTYDSCTALTTSATGVIQCTASAMRFKDSLGLIQPGIAIESLDMLRPAVWSYKPEFQSRFGDGIHVGLYADDVARMDPRCAVYEKGEIKNYEDRCVIAYLVANLQQMRAEIAALKATPRP